MRKPAFKPCFQVGIVEGEAIFLLSELGHFVLRGPLYTMLAPLLDGRRTIDEIVESLDGRFSPAEVFYAVSLLGQKGYVSEAEAHVPLRAAAFWNLHGFGAAAAAERLAGSTVSIHALGDLPADRLRQILAGLDVAAAPDGRVDVVLAEDYLQPELAAFNRERLADGRPWMLVKPVGSVPWIGPIFRPGHTGCWECLAQRIRSNQEVQSYLEERLGARSRLHTSVAALTTTLDSALNLAATEIARWLLGGEHLGLEGMLVTFDLWSLETRRHPLVRRPQCPDCGDGTWAAERAPQPVVLESRKKTFTKDGGHRAISPELTLQAYQHHVSPITGAVSSLERTSPAGDGLMNSYYAGHNSARKYDSLYFLRNGLRSKSGGKGMTDIQARVSGLCEGLERYSGVFQGEESRVTASYRDLGESAIHPNECMLYSEKQYRERQAWNARLSRFQVVPHPFEEREPMEWTPVYSLTRGDFRYLPTAYCYYGYPLPPERFYCWADSNGNASGNTLEEAILQGFLELVERDAVCLWWYNRVSRPGVDLASFDEPYILDLQRHYRGLGRDLWALDLTNDLGIPVFVALSARTDGSPEDIIMGFGAHLDPRIALLRAVTESNQFMPAVIGREAGQDAYAYDDPDALWWWRNATRANQSYVLPSRTEPVRACQDFTRGWSDDLREDVLICQRLVEERGLELLVLDQTRPDIGMPVAKVFVPGLRHFWARFAPGRLYEVPVALGWLDRPLGEDELNPVPMFL